MNHIFKNEKIRILTLIISDIVAVVISSFLALVLRFDIDYIPKHYLNVVVLSLPFCIITTLLVFYFFRLYNRVWSYASIGEMISIIESVFLIEVITICYHVFLDVDLPRSYYPLNLFLLIIMVVISRFGKVLVRDINYNHRKQKKTKKIMIIGAGSAAAILIRDFKNENSNATVICAIDDNINKKNKYIMGVQIVGNRYDIQKYAKKLDINEIIIAMPSVAPSKIKEIIEICQSLKIPVKFLPSVAKSLTKSSLTGEVRPIRYEDFLGRDSFKIDESGIAEFINDKTVLVTGGGGSIGGELCRQIIQYEPKKLLLFDIYENNAYDVQMELERHYPNANLSVLIGSVRDNKRMEQIFLKYKPEIVYHAAAHKHVPLMEKSPNETIKNNCLGTLNLVRLSEKYGVKNFILISTDKAVRPTNIMGASKRICEMIVQTYAKRSHDTRFAAVRFGNVLGSNGSVIPLFLKQIDEGGPVTVTDKRVTRFFMTIPEAVSLVLQASLYAKGGEIFVLDMGKPIRIYELAENLIRMRGYKPNEDISIQITGLRPGEKLYEEVLMDDEGLEKTDNNMIFIGKPLKMDEQKFLKDLENLITEAQKNGNQIKELTKTVCNTYTISND